MNHFLDQMISNVGSKRRAQTETSSEIVKRKSQEEKVKQLEELQRKESQPIFISESGHHNEQHESKAQSEYQVQQITQQIVFDDYRLQNVAIDMRQFFHHTHQSNIHPSSNKQQVSQTIQVFSPNQYSPIGIYNFLQQEHQNKQNHQMISSGEQYNNETAKGIINFRTVETLISGINLAKQAQIQLISWFQAEKHCFSEFMTKAMIEIQLEIKRVLEKGQKQRRARIQAEIRKQLQAQFLIKQQQLQQKHESNVCSQTSSKYFSSLSNQRRWQIQKQLIREQLQQRYSYRLQKLQQQLEQQRKYSEQLIRTYQDTHQTDNNLNSLKNSQIAVSQANKVKNDQLNQELQFMKRQLIERDRAIAEMEMEVERLNQHIFDVQQKVQGIQLEVENRVRQRVKLLEEEHAQKLANHNNTPKNPIQSFPTINQLHPILQNSSHLQQSSRVFSLPLPQPSPLPQLQLQIQHLNRYIQSLQQQKLTIQLQLKEQQKIITFREQQVKKNQQDIAYEWTQIDRERQFVLNRQQEIVTAQENISKKISELRNKQIQIDNWEAQLQKRQLALDIRQQEINQKLQEIVHRQNLSKQALVKLQRQTSLNIFTNQNLISQKFVSQKPVHDFNTEGGGGSFRQNGVQIPQLPIGKRYQNAQTYQQVPIKSEKSFDNEYNFNRNNQFNHNRQMTHLNSKPQDLTPKGTFEKSFESIDRSYTRQQYPFSEKMITGQKNFRPTRPTQNQHQYVLPQNSKPHQHQSRSKSRSKEKTILRNHLQTGSSVSSYSKNPSSFNNFNKGKHADEYYQNRPTSNLDGLGSKLQRLRDQIKREIDSIK